VYLGLCGAARGSCSDIDHGAARWKPTERSAPVGWKPKRRCSAIEAALPLSPTIAIICRRYRDLIPDRPAYSNFERWYAAIAARKAFADHVASVPLV